MNVDLVLMIGALILLAISGLLVFCFTESKGKNTPYARKTNKPMAAQAASIKTSQALGTSKLSTNN